MSVQLTLINHELLRAINPRELLDLRWMKKDASKLAPNLLKLIDRFNLESRWVSTQIVSVGVVADRVSVIARMLKIAHVCTALLRYRVYPRDSLLLCLALSLSLSLCVVFAVVACEPTEMLGAEQL